MSTISSPLISAEALAERLGEPALRLFDCRFDLADPAGGERDYRVAHLPGAVYAHLDRDLSGPVTPVTGRHPLPANAAFEARLRAWGLGTGTIAVAYDAGNGMYAARFWWMARWLGHDRTLVLDGGFARWRSLGLPVTTDEPTISPGDFVAHPRPDLAVDALTVLAVAADTGCRVLDARAPERFRGETEPLDSVAGHVPGRRQSPADRIPGRGRPAARGSGAASKLRGNARRRAAGARGRDVRLGRDRLSSAARDGTGWPGRRPPLPRLVERVDPRSTQARGTRLGAGSQFRSYSP